MRHSQRNIVKSDLECKNCGEITKHIELALEDFYKAI